MPVYSEAFSSVISFTNVLNSSKPSVRVFMNSLFSRPSAIMTCAIEFNNQLSEPGLTGRYNFACCANQIRLGSATMKVHPFLKAFFISNPTIGCASVGLPPIRNISLQSLISLMELVIEQLPNDIARQATVGACQVRAHWSTLFVPITALANFIAR